MTTLFVVDRNILLKQTVDAFKKVGLKNIGTITNGKQEWDCITVASIQTINSLIKKRDKIMLENLSIVNMIIIDEAHGSKAKSYQTMFKHAGPIYKIGLTGTAYADGNSSLELYKSFGFVDYRITTEHLIEKDFLTKPEIIFLEYPFPDEVYGGDYNEVYDKTLNSKERLNELHSVIDKHPNENILIMVDKLDHIKTILGSSNMLVIQGSTPEKVRNSIIDLINITTGNVLIATSSIIQKGVDIPSLSVIINYSANKGSVKTIQSLGRILRKKEGKDKAWYYDFYDTHRKLISHTKARIEALQDQGYK